MSDIPNGRLEPSISVSQSQLALALSIQKSKPDDMSTKEYCMRLRKHVKLEKPSVESQHAYIDTAAFWKDQATKLHDEKEKLKQELCDLKDQVHAINEAEVAQSSKSGISSVGLKEQQETRKRTAEEDLEELEFQSDCQMDSHPVTIPRPLKPPQRSDFEMLRLAKKIAEMLEDPNADGGELNALLNLTITELSNFTHTKCVKFERCFSFSYINNAIPSRARPFKHYSYRVVYRIVLMGMAHLCRDIQGRQRYMEHLVSRLVMHFNQLLKGLQQLCKTAVNPGAERILEYSGTPSTPTSQLFQQCPPRAIRVRRLILNWIVFLQEPIAFAMQFVNCTVIAEVLEGFYCVILRRIGRLLSKVVFHEDVAASTKPGYIGSLEQRRLSTKEMLQIEEEGFHLNSLLKASKDRLQHNYDITAFLNGQWKVENTQGRCQLRDALKRKMQETLLKAVFGRTKKTFQHAMRSPPPFVENEPSAADAVEVDGDVDSNGNDTGPSFVESIWETLGWDAVSMI